MSFLVLKVLLLTVNICLSIKKNLLLNSMIICKMLLSSYFLHFINLLILLMENLKTDRIGAKSVEVDLKQQKATVTGYVEPKKVLKAAQSTKKKVELWPYVPYTMVANPYISQAYDKKAPPNMVRKVADTTNISETTVDDRYIQMFSDENPNACSIM